MQHPRLRLTVIRGRRAVVFTAVAALAVTLLSACSLFGSGSAAPTATTPPTASPVPSSTPTPTPREPSSAPDGRTGISSIDSLIGILLSADAPEIASRYGKGPYGNELIAAGLTPAQWSAQFVAGNRSLFTVVKADPVEFPARDYNVVIRVQAPRQADEFWSFALRANLVVDVANSTYPDLEFFTGEGNYAFRGQAGTFQLPSIERLPERYLVLPPADYLPRAPKAYGLSVRTGDAGVDRLLALIDAKDTQGLSTAIDPHVIDRRCETAPEKIVDATPDAAFVQAWASDLVSAADSLYAVVELPDGYQPAARHLLILITREGPYWWQTQGILETGGAVVAIISPAWLIDTQPNLVAADGSVIEKGSVSLRFGDCLPLPPAAYLVPPPQGGLAGLDPTRRSGMPLVDSLLDALHSGNASAMEALIDYSQRPCVVPLPNLGTGGDVPCEQNETAGTLVDVLPISVCEGGWSRRPAADQLISDRQHLALYAMVAPNSLVLASPDGRSQVWQLSDKGLQGISSRCGDQHPDRMLGGYDTTRFLLPPL